MERGHTDSEVFFGEVCTPLPNQGKTLPCICNKRWSIAGFNTNAKSCQNCQCEHSLNPPTIGRNTCSLPMLLPNWKLHKNCVYLALALEQVQVQRTGTEKGIGNRQDGENTRLHQRQNGQRNDLGKSRHENGWYKPCRQQFWMKNRWSGCGSHVTGTSLGASGGLLIKI